MQPEICYLTLIKLGALYVSDTVLSNGILNPIIFGGAGQEFGLRGGTENVPGIVGFGEACRDISNSDSEYISTMASTFASHFVSEIAGVGLFNLVSFNGYDPEARKITYEINKPYKTMAFVSIVGKDLKFSHPQWFVMATKIASNVDIFPRVDGTVQIDFTFNGFANRID